MLDYAPSFRALAEGQNRPRCNELRNRILSPEDRCPYPHDPAFLKAPARGRYFHFPSLPLRGVLLLFGKESWVLTGKMETALDAFQGRVARRLTGRTPRRGRDGKWKYLPMAGAFKNSGS